jgi:hypothetical protein
MRNTPGLAGAGSSGERRHAFAILRARRRLLRGLGLVLAPILAVATAALPDQQRGHPADWLAAAAFLAAGLIICSRLFEAGVRVCRRRWGLAGLCLTASIASVAVSPAKIIALGSVELSLRMLMLAGIASLICAIWASGGEERPHLMRIELVGVLTLTALLVRELTLVYMLSGLLGIVVYGAHSRGLTAPRGVWRHTVGSGGAHEERWAGAP